MGSIAHCDGWAVCAVLKAEHLSVGIDIEHRLAHQTASEVQAMIGTAQEWTLLAQQFDLASAVTLLFSAKESLFKALFPQVQIYLDFSDAQLIGLDGNQLTLRLSIDRKPLIPDADYKVHFVWQESRVISAIRQIKRVSEC
ncbi:Phosphopantetheinyl transferase component of siderophore synthetase [Vibrio cholerae]|nr:Phosphopantetheinyl transferase component of siderophore synthetase [Vibrio cholerae]